LIESGKYPLEKMHTHTFGLSSLERALLTLAGRVPGENAVSVSINPML
jgi:threonine dehydrogenase-like Zn-dependent dehydrogenase